MLQPTASAVAHLKELIASRGADPAVDGLRLGVERGGCAGLQYAMKVGSPQDGDTVIEHDGVRLFIPADSVDFLKGARLDYTDSLNDAGFKIENPNAARSCGCGTSFEPAAPAAH